MPGSEFGPRGREARTGRERSEKTPRWGVCRPLCVSRHGSAASEPRRPLHNASQRRLWCFFFCQKQGMAAPMALHGAKGGVLFRKREHPLYIPQRKAYIAGLALEELHTLRSVGAVYVAAPRAPAFRCIYQPRALRSARVTLPRRQTALRPGGIASLAAAEGAMLNEETTADDALVDKLASKAAPGLLAIAANTFRWRYCFL